MPTNPFDEMLGRTRNTSQSDNPFDSILQPSTRLEAIGRDRIAQRTQEHAEGEGTEFGKGVKRGIAHTKALAHGGLAALQEAIGLDEASEDRWERYQTLVDEASQYEGKVQRVEDIDSFEEFLAWSSGMLGEQIPVLAGFLFTGGVGGITARLAANKLIKKGTKEVIDRKVKGWASKGALAGGFGFGATLGTGEVAGEAKEEGLDQSPLMSLGFGGLIGALDVVPVVVLARGLGVGKEFTSEFMKRVVALPRAKRAAVMSALVGVSEAGTETLQEVLALTARSISDEQFEMLGPEGRSRLLNAAAGGLLVGGVFGGAAGAVGRRRAARERQPSEEDSGLGVVSPAEESDPSIGLEDDLLSPSGPGETIPNFLSDDVGMQTVPFPEERGIADLVDPTAQVEELMKRLRDPTLTPFMRDTLEIALHDRAGFQLTPPGMVEEIELSNELSFVPPYSRADGQMEMALGPEPTQGDTVSPFGKVRHVTHRIQPYVIGQDGIDFRLGLETNVLEMSPLVMTDADRALAAAIRKEKKKEQLIGKEGTESPVRAIEIVRDFRRRPTRTEIGTVPAKALEPEPDSPTGDPKEGVEVPANQVQTARTIPLLRAALLDPATGQVYTHASQSAKDTGTHGQVRNAYDLGGRELESGFVDADGTYMGREEALAYIQQAAGVELTDPASPTQLDSQAAQAIEEFLEAGAIEDVDSGIVVEQAAVREGFNLERLNLAQRKRLVALAEKEQLEGLSQREYEVLEKLLTRAAEGEENLRIRPDDNEALMAIVEEVRAAESGTLDAQGDGGQKKKRMTKEAVQEIVRIFQGRYPGANHIAVLGPKDAAMIPSRLRRKVHPKSGARGFHDTQSGVSFLVAHNLSSPVDVWKTLLHEVLIHDGIRRFLTPAEREQFLRLVLKSVDLTALRERYSEQHRRWENLYGKEAADLMIAEEYLAFKAMRGEENSLLQRVAAFLRRVIRKFIPELKLSNAEMIEFIQDMDRKFRGAIIGNYSSPNYQGEIMLSLGETLGLDIKDREGVSEQISTMGSFWMSKMRTWFQTPLQLIDRYKVKPAEEYLRHVERWWNTKISILEPAERVTSEWRKLGKERGNLLAKSLFDISIESDELGRRLSRDEVNLRLRKVGADPETVDTYWKIDQSFQEVLDRLERGLEYNAARESVGAAEAVQLLEDWRASKTTADGRSEFLKKNENIAAAMRLAEIHEELGQLRNRNYFPRTRFGRYVVVAIAKKQGLKDERGRELKKGQVAHFETAESRIAQKDVADALGQELGGDFEVRMSKLNDEEFSFLGMPPSMEKALRTQLNLSQSQQEALKEIFIRLSPGRRFLKRLIKRKNVPGFSEDAMRVYATYFMHAGSYLARVEHYHDLHSATQNLRGLLKRLSGETDEDFQARREVAGVGEGTDDTVLAELANYFDEHYDYIMNPGNDLAQLRAIGFMWYLGANVKSAWVNLTQVPMVTYPYLGATYGDGKAVGAIMKAYGDVSKMMLGKKSGISEQEAKALTQAVQEGFIDESLATEIAGIGEAPGLFRMMPENTGSLMINRFSYYSAFLFRSAEKYNRRVAFLAGHRLARQAGADTEAAFAQAKKSVQATQFEYSKWNRPKFMRGKKSVFFLFWQYMQHASFLAFGGHGKATAMRFWAMSLMLAGLQGLPFAENAMDLFDFIMTKIKGDKSSIRGDLRELAQEITDNPDLIMHGLSRYYGLGPLHALSLLGVPIPHTNISASLSLGNIIPGTEDLLGHERNPDMRLARTAVEMAGPVVGIPYLFWRFAMSDEPDRWKAYERVLPTAIQSLSKSARWLSQGVERKGTAEIYSFEDSYGRAEAIAASLGFSSSGLSSTYERMATQEEARRYYLTRRAFLLENFGYAYLMGDREGKADALTAIKRYNNEVPHRALAINSDAISRSLRARAQRAKLVELGIPNERSLRPLYQEIAERFPDFER